MQKGQRQRLESNSEAKVCFLEVVLTCQYEGEGLCTDLTICEQLACVLPSCCHQVVQQAVIPGLLLCILLLPCTQI